GGKAPPRAASPYPHSARRGVELVIFIGLQASGKTTFYRARFAQTHAHVSKDNFPNNRNPERRQRELIEQAFAEGRAVVVDNTNATAEARRPLLALAQAHGVPVVGYYFQRPGNKLRRSGQVTALQLSEKDGALLLGASAAHDLAALQGLRLVL